jgi:hypothetical protein
MKDLLSYNPLTGVFLWKVSRGPTVKAGDVAGSLRPDGYRSVYISGKRYLAHRLAWYFTHDCWPEGQIDHIDGNRSNNAIGNLEDVTGRENVRRGMLRYGKKTGLPTGVSVHYNGFRADACINGKPTYLGRFDDPQEAHQAYLEAIS